MFETLTELVSGSPWTYAIVLAAAALDPFLPVVPSEATAVAAGVLAGAGELSVALVIAAAVAGAFAGDVGSYATGRALGDRADRRVFRGDRGRRRREQARRLLAARGGLLILLARFVPGGRTAATVTAGLTRMPARRFVRLAGMAAAAWGTYVGLLGYVGGRAFEEEPWKGLVLAFVLAGGLALLVEGGRRVAPLVRTNG